MFTGLTGYPTHAGCAGPLDSEDILRHEIAGRSRLMF